ncbi:MAG: helix-turn-helix transcriptional regulator [Oscillospiraceae bacterium]|nr:helix-turn-helix transcriptional regulator [Oscillospiraceae bacterium]
MGLSYSHDKEFSIDRPNGSGDELLLIFITEAMVSLEEGDVIAPPRSAILYKKGVPQRYKACGDKYSNHFLHMDCTGEDEFFSSVGFPFNKVIPLWDCSEAEELMRMISREEMSASPFKDRYMDMLIKLLILKIAECSEKKNTAQVRSIHSSALGALRAELYSNAGSFGSVSDLARSVNLSPSHFQQLYREQFGVSCYEDLLSARMKAAEYYLKNTALTVKEIAALCGYENDVCFMRLFRRKIGMTPSEYRKYMNSAGN